MFTPDIPTNRTDAMDILRDAIEQAGWDHEGSDQQVAMLLVRIAPTLQYLSREYARIPAEVRNSILDAY